jgi:hypothetical protein
MDSEQGDQDESKHGIDAADKEGAEGAKQKDNPGIDEVAGSGGEGDDKGGLGDRTGASGGATPTEPDESHDAGELRR